MHGPLPEVTPGSQLLSLQNLYHLYIKPKDVDMILFWNKNLE